MYLIAVSASPDFLAASAACLKCSCRLSSSASWPSSSWLSDETGVAAGGGVAAGTAEGGGIGRGDTGGGGATRDGRTGADAKMLH